MPLFAWIGTTGTPSRSLSFAQSILMPCASATSIMLTATTTGTPRSSSWVVR